MQIAILGASSQIAKGLIKLFAKKNNCYLKLFVRDQPVFKQWIELQDIKENFSILHFDEFVTNLHVDLIINCIGVGDPSKLVQLGSTLLETTKTFDDLALNYLTEHPLTKYIFLSSGAVYGNNFKQPVDTASPALININDLHHSDWYSIAKIYAEAKHRSMEKLCIMDIRIFNYISNDMDIESRFLISDALRAISKNEILQTNSHNIYRDYIGSEDLHQLIMRLTEHSFLNVAVDCFTSQITDKFSILDNLKSNFGLKYELIEAHSELDAGGSRDHYYSLNKKAANYGYTPNFTSLENISMASEELLR